MSDWNRRMPRIGDLIVHKNPRTGEARRFGLVHKIKKDKHGHESVFIEWTDGLGEDSTWREDHGYSSSNIHNLRKEWVVIRDGVNIP